MEQRQQQRMLQVLALAASLAAFDAHAALTKNGQPRAAHSSGLELATCSGCGGDSGDSGGSGDGNGGIGCGGPAGVG